MRKPAMCAIIFFSDKNKKNVTDAGHKTFVFHLFPPFDSSRVNSFFRRTLNTRICVIYLPEEYF